MLGIRGEPIEAGNSVVLSCTFTFMIKEVSMGCRRKALWQHLFYSLAHPNEKKSQRKGQGKFMVAKNRFKKIPLRWSGVHGYINAIEASISNAIKSTRMTHFYPRPIKSPEPAQKNGDLKPLERGEWDQVGTEWD